MRKPLAIAALALALTIPGVPVLADDGSGTCPDVHTGAQFGEHVSEMARAGHLGADMNPGMHQGYSHMRH